MPVLDSDSCTGLFGDIQRSSVLWHSETLDKATLKALNCKANEAIFFGDSDVDVKTAKNAGIEAIACSWGYRSFESLLAQSPSAIIDEPKYISKLF